METNKQNIVFFYRFTLQKNPWILARSQQWTEPVLFPAQSRDLGWRKKEAYTLKVQPGKGKRKMKLKLNLFPVEAVWFDVPVTGNTRHKKKI